MVSVPAKKVEGWALPEMPGKEYESQYIDLYGVIWQRRGLKGGGGHSISFVLGGSAPRSNSLLFYITTAVNTHSLKYEYITKPERFLDFSQP